MTFLNLNAQILRNSIIVDSLSFAESPYVFFGVKTIKLRDNSILTLRPYGIRIINESIPATIIYDSIQTSTYTLTGVRTNNNGFKINDSVYINDLIQTDNGNILLAGTLNDSTIIILLDSTGNFLRKKSYPKVSADETIKKIYPLSDNNLIIFSVVDTIDGYEDCFTTGTAKINRHNYITKIDIEGNILWRKELPEDKIYSLPSLGGILLFIPTIMSHFDGSFSLIKYSQNGYSYNNDSLRIEYTQLDVSGNINEQKYLKSIIRDYCYNYDFFYYYALDTNFYIFKNNDIYYQNLLFTKYRYDSHGNLIDTVALNYNDNSASLGNYFITSYSQLEFYHQSFTSFKDNMYGIIPYYSANSLSLFTLYYGKTFENIDSCSEYFSGNTFLINDSILLYVNIVDKYWQDSTMYLRFVEISVNDAQLFYTAYIDRNNNAHFDIDDTKFSNARIEITDLVQTTSYSFDQFGHYNYYTFPGRYISKLISYDQQLRYYNIAPITDTSILTHRGQVDSVFFRLVPKPNIQDLQVSVIPTSGARPGFQSTYKILAKNVGTKTIENIEVKFLKDALQTIESATILPTSVLDDTLIWTIDSMAILESKEFTVTCRNDIPPDLNANDTLHLFACITPFDNDSFITDNSFLLNQVVVNSVDPNDKIEAHGSGITTQQLTNGDYLYYTIRFQNTGTGYASRIKITDTLSDKLNWNTLDILANTNNLAYTIENKNIIIWWNDNVYLPDSTSDEINSHGYVSFRIKPVSDLSSADIVENRAHIYFDYNAAVITNTVTTQILEQRITNIKQKEIKEIRLYPSPTNNIVQLEFNAFRYKNITLKIIDLQGKEIYTETLKSNIGLNSVQLNLSAYANGVYFIQLNTDSNNLYYGKVLKQ